MGFKTGTSGNPNGRPTGSVNKATSLTRDAFNKLLEDNLANLSLWLTEVAADDPARALEIVTKLAEYTTPKLARTVTTLEVQEKKQFNVVIEKLEE